MQLTVRIAFGDGNSLCEVMTASAWSLVLFSFLLYILCFYFLVSRARCNLKYVEKFDST